MSTVSSGGGTAVVERECVVAGIDVVRERRTRSEEVYLRLREAIVGGELPPGAHLRDSDLAEDLGTSRTLVGDALARLAAQGLVEMRRNRSTRVAPLDLDLDPIRDAVALLGDIWIGSAGRAMLYVQHDDVTSLVDLTDDLLAAGSEGDVLTYGMALRAIAIGFARLEGNDVRECEIERLGPQIRRFAQHAAGSFDRVASEESTLQLREAIVRRDATQVRTALLFLFDDVLPGIIDRAATRIAEASRVA
ncbi:GntR family transcriptional regulator [Microbacterium maritypicum]|uniref:GntR family transcriptional regulator n=1 Tax=Microbacterium maritypicum TaxID=33918 RepID=UPI003D70CF2E